jgi:hypothetical protein
MMMLRPMPMRDMLDGFAAWFAPAHEVEAWARAAFIEDGAALENPDHAHLQAARIGFLWTNVENCKKGRTVIGTAEPGAPQGAMGKWSRARAELQVVEWFGAVPDFIITIDGVWWLQASDAEACALVEHELYHCAQAVDEFGVPKFNRQTGRPCFTLRGHDVEEFVGVVRRYGAEATGVRALVDAVNAKPEIAAAAIAQCCGTCRIS